MTRSLDTSLVPEPEPEPQCLTPVRAPPGGSVRRCIGLRLLGEGDLKASGALRSSDMSPRDTNPVPSRGSKTRLGAKWTRSWFSAGRRTEECSEGQTPDTPCGGQSQTQVLRQTWKLRGAGESAPKSGPRSPQPPSEGPDAQLVRAALGNRS